MVAIVFGPYGTNKSVKIFEFKMTFYLLIHKNSGEWQLQSIMPTTSPLKERMKKMLRELTLQEDATDQWVESISHVESGQLIGNNKKSKV